VKVTLELLTHTPHNEARVQRIFDAAPNYSMLTEGHAPEGNAAREAFESAPPNGTLANKRMYMICANGDDIGLVDLYFGWNEPHKACIGLLLLDERLKRQGFGARAFALTCDEIKQMRVYSTIRIGVVQTNVDAFPFWRAMGFMENGEVKHGDDFVAPITIMERGL
jgi:GNAT superfamily N-acetyltransferase